METPGLPLRLRDGNIERGLGAKYCSEKARAEGLSIEALGDRICVHEQKLTQEDRTPLRIDSWMIGGDLSIAIVSLTTDLTQSRPETALPPPAWVERAVRSLRFHERVEVVETEKGPVATRVSAAEEQLQQIHDFETDDQRWLAESLLAAAERASDETVAHAVGAAFGEHLVRSTGMRWVVVTDEHGRSRAVRHPRGNTVAFPVESVHKRIATGATNFLENLAAVIAQQIGKGDPPA